MDQENHDNACVNTQMLDTADNEELLKTNAIEFDLSETDESIVEFNPDENIPMHEYGAKIRVIGVGGGGCKAIECMTESDMAAVELIAINTDTKSLCRLQSKVGKCENLKLVQLGPKTTRGLGAGSIPENGATAAQESEGAIRKLLQGCDMVFVTVGLGGGTGTGASPILARVAKELGILTVAVATLPFYSEGKRRWKTAIEGMEKLRKEVDSLILIPNQKIIEECGQKSVLEGYRLSDQVLVDAVRGISDLILSAGDFGGIDFADVRTCLADKGMAVISVGSAKATPKCAEEALRAVLHNPMLEDCDISGAKGILCNVFGSSSLKVTDAQLINDEINAMADEDAIIKFGTTIEEPQEDSKDGIRIVLVASGINIRNIDVETISRDKQNQSSQSPTDESKDPNNEEGVSSRRARTKVPFPPPRVGETQETMEEGVEAMESPLDKQQAVAGGGRARRQGQYLTFESLKKFANKPYLD